MTDKVQKIKDWISKTQDGLMDANGNFEYPEHEGAYHILCNLDTYIDSMQEEPKFKTGDRIKPIDSCLGSPRTIVDICDSWYVTDQGTLDFEYEDNWELVEEPVSERFAFKAIHRLLEMIEPTDRVKAYIAKLADALEVEGYHTDAKIVRESLKIMNGEKVPMATMDEEPVSEDLGEYINELSKQFPEVSFAKLSRIAVRVAKWQKKQDQSTIELAEDHAMLAGMERMKEQMMAKAIDVEVKVDAGGYPYIPQMELYDYDKDIPLAKEGDKYKVILIKEE